MATRTAPPLAMGTDPAALTGSDAAPLGRRGRSILSVPCMPPIADMTRDSGRRHTVAPPSVLPIAQAKTGRRQARFYAGSGMAFTAGFPASFAFEPIRAFLIARSA